MKNRLNFFEKEISSKIKGAFRVWESNASPIPHFNVSVFLHAINDGKVVHLITNKFGALPLVKMEVTDKDAETSKKVKFEIETTAAQ